MKKFLGIVAAVAVAVALTGCMSNDMTTSKKGWSNYTEITVKDFDSVGIVQIETSETTKVSPFFLNTSHVGKKVTYADLMAQAKKLGADDIINVRIDQRAESSFSPLQILTGSTTTTTYYGTALAIKYKSVVPNQKIDATGREDNVTDGVKLPGIKLPF